MSAVARQKIKLATVLLLLAGQGVLAWLSMGPLAEISLFCTGAKGRLEFFGFLHLLFAGLFVLGLVSLAWSRIRLVYAALIVVSLLALPVQARLVDRGQLHCDGP